MDGRPIVAPLMTLSPSSSSLSSFTDSDGGKLAHRENLPSDDGNKNNNNIDDDYNDDDDNDDSRLRHYLHPLRLLQKLFGEHSYINSWRLTIILSLVAIFFFVACKGRRHCHYGCVTRHCINFTAICRDQQKRKK